MFVWVKNTPLPFCSGVEPLWLVCAGRARGGPASFILRLATDDDDRNQREHSQAKQFFHKCCREFVLPVESLSCTHRKHSRPLRIRSASSPSEPTNPLRYPKQVRERSHWAQCTKGSPLAKRENRKLSGRLDPETPSVIEAQISLRLPVWPRPACLSAAGAASAANPCAPFLDRFRFERPRQPGSRQRCSSRRDLF